MPLTLRNSVLGSVPLTLAGVASVSAQTTTVSGVVRDARGVPQMGVVVDLQGASVAATALTDLRGHYQIRDLSPGVYQLRASAMLYLPALRQSLALHPGRPSVVNLTLRALYDDTSLSSPSHRDPAQTLDDWKWTLRSVANKPMLRLLDDSGEELPLEAKVGGPETHAKVRITSGATGFGSPSHAVEVAFAARSGDGSRRGLISSSVASGSANGI